MVGKYLVTTVSFTVTEEGSMERRPPGELKSTAAPLELPFYHFMRASSKGTSWTSSDIFKNMIWLFRIGPVELSTESGFLAWLFKDMQCHMLLWVEAVNQMQPVCEYSIYFTQFCFENWWHGSNLALIGTSPLIQASINRGGTWLRHQRLHSTFIIWNTWIVPLLVV